MDEKLQDRNIQYLKRLTDKWPSALVAREKVGEFSGGTLHPRSMANLDSLNQGPPSVKLGRKVAYPAIELVEWLIKRIEGK